MVQSTVDDDIEYFTPGDAGWDELKSIIWDTGRFNRYIADRGTLGALEAVTVFHRTVANQLLVSKVDDPKSSKWAARTIGLCSQLKHRRAQLRTRYAIETSYPELGAVIDRLKAEHPRAVWGQGAPVHTNGGRDA